jgi:hypothetical protein
MYGVDWDSALPVASNGNHVEVPVTDSPLTDADLTVISAEINPLQHSDQHGIDIYQATLAFVIIHSQRDD